MDADEIEVRFDAYCVRTHSLYTRAIESHAELLEVTKELGGLDIRLSTMRATDALPDGSSLKTYENTLVMRKAIMQAIAEKVFPPEFEYKVDMVLGGEAFVFPTRYRGEPKW